MERNERLTILRMLNGLTQELLSSKSGLPRGSIGTWEKGNYAPSHEAAPRLADALNVPVGYLMYGSPPLSSAVWQPVVPASRHFPLFAKELVKNIPALCKENEITRYASYQGDDGKIIFLGKGDRPFSFLLLQKAELDGCISTALKPLEEHHIEGLQFLPLLSIGFLERMDVEHLKGFIRFAQSSDLEVDGDAIVSEFLKTKQNLGLISSSDRIAFSTNAFIHMRAVYDELERPAVWRPAVFNPRAPTLIEHEAMLFERVSEVCEEKSLIWTGVYNDELGEMIRGFLKSHGYQERSLD